MKTNLDKEKNFVSAVVYLRNCSERVIEFLEMIDYTLNNHFQNYEFILVDDCSEDETINKVRQFQDNTQRTICVIKMAYFHGKEKSMRAGVDLSIGDFVYEFDTTAINYDLSLIYDVYKKSLEGYDAVAATQSLKAQRTSLLFYKILEKTSKQSIKLESETFRIVSRRMINRSMDNKNQVFYRKAIYHNSGLETAIIYYNPVNDVEIRDQLSISQQSNLAMDILMNHSQIGTRIAGIVSLAFLLFAVVTTAYTIYTYLTLESIQPGWATTMFFLSVSLAGVFFILFIITKYLTNILVEVRKEPMYTYKSVDKM